jgi:hypothetical protein
VWKVNTPRRLGRPVSLHYTVLPWEKELREELRHRGLPERISTCPPASARRQKSPVTRRSQFQRKHAIAEVSGPRLLQIRRGGDDELVLFTVSMLDNMTTTLVELYDKLWEQASNARPTSPGTPPSPRRECRRAHCRAALQADRAPTAIVRS